MTVINIERAKLM